MFSPFVIFVYRSTGHNSCSGFPSDSSGGEWGECCGTRSEGGDT